MLFRISEDMLYVPPRHFFQPMETTHMKKRILPLLVLGSAIFGAAGLLASCGDSEESLAGPTTVLTGAGGRVEFSTVQPILTAKCAACHKEDNYDDSATIARGVGAFQTAIASGAMPAAGSAPLSSSQKATVLAWLNSLAPSEGPALPITREKCATCHGSYSDSAKLSSAAARVQNAVQIDYMPEPSVGMLTPVEKATLLAWLKQEQGL